MPRLQSSTSSSLSATFIIRIFIIIIIIAVATNTITIFPSCYALVSTTSLGKQRRNYYCKPHPHSSHHQQQQQYGYLQYKQQHDDYERRGYYNYPQINRNNNNRNRKAMGESQRGIHSNDWSTHTAVVEAGGVSMTQNSAYLHAMEDQRYELNEWNNNNMNYLTAGNNNNVQMLDYENRINARFSRHRRRLNLRTHLQTAVVASSVLLPSSLPTAKNVMRPQMLQGVPIPIFNNHHIIHRRRIINLDYPCNNNDIEEECIALPPDQFEDATYSECNVLHCTNILIPFDTTTNKNIMEEEEEEEGALIIGTTIVNDIKYYILQIYHNVLVPYRRNTPFDVPMVDTSVAYWLRNQLHLAIYGRVRYGTILQCLSSPLHVELLTTMDENNGGSTTTTATTVSYISTGTSVAIKEISWDSISEQGYKLAEDPIKEVAAMQYISNFLHTTQQEQQQQQQWSDNDINNNNIVVDDDTTAATTTNKQQQQHPNHHIMLPIDLLSNEKYLYSITPYYNGGRLLDRIENKGRLSEVESRYYIRQILIGLSNLKVANVVHRDISPENIMLHDNECYIIDMGMCLRIPTLPPTTATTTTTTMIQQQQGQQQQQQQRRALILPQTPCGKWHYLSPEICASIEPFDGPAVDLWAVGIILYIMLTGSPPPWNEPRLTDTNFSNCMECIISEENASLGLSSDVLNLLQCMLRYDPADRLCLEQVMNHPWMMTTSK